MDKTKKWRKILAMMLTVVMMLQNAQSVMVFADVTNEQIEQRLAGGQTQTEQTQPDQSQVETRANGEEYKTQPAESQDNGNDGVDIGSPDSDGTTIEAKTSSADVSATITQSVFQADVSGTTCNFVQMTAQIKNNDTENAATGVSVKALLNSSQLNYVNGYGTETSGAGAYYIDSNNTSDLPAGSTDGYDQIVMWTDQTIGADETVEYQFAAQIIPKTLDGVADAWYVNGTSCSYTWENTEVLTPAQDPEATPKVTPDETPEPTPEVTETPEETPTPEVTETPEETPTPEVTETPEETPTPEVTETPEEIPTPEVTEAPEETPTPEPTQAAEDDDKQAILDKQDKLLSQSKDRLNLKKAPASNAKKNADAEENDEENSENVNTTKTSTKLDDYLTNATLASSPKFEDGTIYDANHPLASNGYFYLKLNFAEDKDTNSYQFPIYDPSNAAETTVTFKIPEGIKSFDAVVNAPIIDQKDTTKTYGIYDIDTNGNISIRFNDNVGKFTNCEGYIIFQAQFHKDMTNDETIEKIIFSKDVDVDVKIKKGDAISATKTASAYGDPIPGKFTFTITVNADEDVTNATIIDKLGENLVLDIDSIKWDGTESLKAASKGNNEYSIEIPEIKKGTHQITYTASIKDDALLDYVDIPGLDNTATINYGNNKSYTTKGDAEYSHNWLKKENSGIETDTGEIKWTIKVTPPSGKVLDGMTIKDVLPRAGLNYDTRQDIIIKNVTKDTETTIGWTNVSLSEDGKSWTYVMPKGSGSDTYEISYYTTVTGDVSGTVSNSATIENRQEATSSVKLSGSGSGTGSGAVNKVAVDTVKDDKGKIQYVKWQSTLTIPANTNGPVIYYDTLTGNHVFEGKLTKGDSGYSSIKIEGWNGADPEITNTTTGFTVNFGTVTTDKELNITLTYYTKVEKSGTVTNKGELGVNNKFTSDDASKIINNSTYRKFGNYNSETGIMTWTVVINTRGNTLSGEITVVDTISDNQVFKKFNDSDTRWAKLKVGSGERLVGKVDGKTLTVETYIPSTTDEVTLVYQTVLADGVDASQNIEVTNTANIQVEGKDAEEIKKTEIIPSNIFDKKLLQAPSKEKKYDAEFEIDVNSANKTLGADKYTITDTMSSNVNLYIDSIKVKNASGEELGTTKTENGPYYELIQSEDGTVLKIIIWNPEKLADKSYTITYKAQIKPGTDIGETPWDNKAHFEASEYVRDSSSSGTVTKEQNTDSGMKGNRLYINVLKYDASNISKYLKDAKFQLNTVDTDGTLTPINRADCEKVTDENGKLFFGQPENGTTEEINNAFKFKEGVVYCLKETGAPSGYKLDGTGEYYFQIGSEVDLSRYTEVTEKATINSLSIGDTIQVKNIPSTSVTVTKKWNDSNDIYKTRPENIKVYLMADGQEVIGSEQTLNAVDNATYTWDNLDKCKYDANSKTYKDIEYTVGERAVSGYTSSINTTEGSNNFVITNTYRMKTVSKDITKKWEDKNDQDGIRPDSIKLSLKYKNNNSEKEVDENWLNDNYYEPYKRILGENAAKVEYSIDGGKNWKEYTGGKVDVNSLTKSNTWKCQWRNLPEIDGISYTVTEEVVDGYNTSYNGNTIINTHKVEETSRTVKKEWASAEKDENGNRPSEVTVKLYKGNDTNPYDVDGTQKLSKANNWTYTWNNLPKYEDGAEIVWIIKEEPVLGYTTAYSPENGVTSDSSKDVTITNTYSDETASISAYKNWIDNNNKDKLRPDSITLKLQKSVYDLNTSKYTEKTDVERQEEKTISNTDWAATVTWNGLPKYENGHVIHYSVVENAVEHYSTKYSPAEVNADANFTNIQVTNSYSSKANVQFNAYKELSGNRNVPLKANEFAFLLKDKDNNTLQTKYNDVNGSVAFDPIEYTTDGTFTYTISEQNDNAENITYDNTIYNVEVKVNNNTEAGKLEVEYVKVNGSRVDDVANYKFNFTNTYKAEGQGSIIGTKVLTGGTLTDGLFHFGLYNDSDGKEPVENENGQITATNQNGKFTLLTPKYTQDDIGKVYTYYVKENVDIDKQNIYTYDTHTWKVNVSITDSANSDGRLNVQVVTADGSSEFKNIYNANGTLVLTALKKVEGRADIPNKFTFNLYKSDADKTQGEQIQSVKNNGASVSFKPINYTASDIGKTYYYLMEEDQTAVAGYTLSNKVYLVKVVVSDDANNKGKLKVECLIIDNDTDYGEEDQQKSETPVFTNKYSATGKIVLKGKKELEGKNLDTTKDENKFQFELYDASTDQKIGETVDINSNGEFSFPELQFNETQLGDHHYEIKEVNAGKPGYTYADPIAVTVTVSDKGDGTLEVTSDKNGTDKNNKGIIFINHYKASIDVPLQVKKILSGRTIENDQFSFSLKEENATETKETKKCNTEGIVRFTPLHFDQTQVGNTYTYIISEDKPSPIPNGYTYSEESYKVTIKISDPKGDGNLAADVQYIKLVNGQVEGQTAVYNENALTFTNKYVASGEYEISGTKKLIGGNKKLADGDFTFELYDKDPSIEGATPIKTAKNDSHGNFSFEKLVFTQDNVDQTTHTGTYTYYVKEKNDKQPGYTYDETVYIITLTVSDEAGDGNLTVTPVIAKNNAEGTVTAIQFSNIFKVDGEVILRANKILTGKALTGGAFEFTLEGNGQNQSKQNQEVENEASGNVLFDPIEYTQEDIGKTYTYEIRETQPNQVLPGYTYSEAVYLAKVVVSDEAGKIKTDVKYYLKDGDKETELKEGEVPTFKNSYEASGEVTISGTKELTGNKALAEDLFTFVLKDADGNKIDEAKNDKKGTFTFKTINYDQDDVDPATGQKDYVYYVEESPVAEGVPYTTSKVVYKVVVHVENDPEKAKLKTSTTVTVEKNDEEETTDVEKLLFVNNYNAEGQIELTAKKTLNVPLKEGQFTFILSGNGNSEYQEVTNDGAGNITFEPLTYTENDINGYYYYTVHEKNLHITGYTYSDEIYQIKVHVTDAGNGALRVEKEITNVKGEPVQEMSFENTYGADGELVLTGEKSYASGVKETKLEAGAYKFEVVEGEKVVATGTNDADGKITFTPIKYAVKADGTSDLRTHLYTVKEVKGTKGYTIYDSSEYTVTVDVTDGQDGKLQAKITEIKKDGKKADKISFVNDLTKVQISKKSVTGTEELEGAELEIRDLSGNAILKWTSGKTAKYVEGLLKAGEKYILVETKAPKGYHIAAEVPFTVNTDGKIKEVTMVDSPTEVTVSKTDITQEKQLAGAKLQILDKDGNVIDEWETDGKPHPVTKQMEAGATYTLHEVTPPTGYRKAEDIKFTVNDNGKATNVVMKDAPTKASILKTDESGKALSGAQLVVKDSTGKEIDKWTTDGKAHEITGLLIVGETYTLSEVSAPSGYTVAPDQTFKMEDKDVIEVTMVDYQASGSGQITVTKKVTLAQGGENVDLIAEDDTFYVNLFTDAAGKYPYKGSMPQAIHLVNSSAGSVTFSDLAQGTYYVYETDANGNVVDLETQLMHNGSQFMCTVNGGSNTVKLDLKSGPKEGAVNLENVFYDIPTGYSYKGEININKQVMKGTSQTTTDDTFYAGIFTKDDQGVYNLFTVVPLVQNDTVTVEVPLGGEDGTEPINYYILETDADGNILDLDVFEYEVTGEGTVALSKDNLTGNINLVNTIPEEKDGKLRVQKTDGNGVGLAGASFRLTDEDGDVVEEWTSEASAHELELEPGTYTLTEVQAPTGYTGAGSVTIVVDDDYNFSVSGEIEYSYGNGLLKIVNKVVPSTPSSGTPVSGGSTPNSYSSALSGKVAVKTGDNTPIGAYAAVLVIAALAIAGGIVYKKKKKKGDK